VARKITRVSTPDGLHKDMGGARMSGFDETFDFVVVGSGAGSLCASLVMRSAGKSVVVLEKLGIVGGTTARSGGVMWIPNNPFMQRDGDDSFEKALTYLDAVCGDDPTAKGATRERRITFLREAPKMVDFLLSQGVRLKRGPYWPDYYDELPGSSEQGRTVVPEVFDANALGSWRTKMVTGFMPVPAEYDEVFYLPHFKRDFKSFLVAFKVALRIIGGKLTGKHYITSGAALQGRTLQAALREGADIRLNSPVQELVVEDGRVTGVVATLDGQTRRIGARLGVLVNGGGFARNQAMRDKYQPGTSVDWSETELGDTGEMIQEMMRQGAAISQMEEMVGNQVTRPPGLKEGEMRPFMQTTTTAPHAILVDQSGVRYQNEGGSYMAVCKGMLERSKTVPAVPSWTVIDSQYLSKYMFAMADAATLKRWLSQNFLKKADTIEDLARQMKVDPAALKATVERFNGFVAKNKDEDFGRGERAYDRWLGDPHSANATLGAIEKAPFYAIPTYPGDVGTYGGVVTDEHARVLREDGSIIPGLYATATSTASAMGRFYPGAGASVGPGYTWGYVAARHAANLDNVADSPAATKAKAGARA
jgi:3-oxosteroid 1-dehydrogenase